MRRIHAHDGLLGLAAAFGFGLTLVAFWPGYLSFDSAYQWWQARHGQYTSVHPPLLAMAWSLSERVHSGPGPVWAGLALAFWVALAGIVRQVAMPNPVRIGALWLAGFWPPVFALLAHVWKDVAVMSLFALAVMWLAHPVRGRRRLYAAIACLVAGSAMRHNAASALLPLYFWIAWEALPSTARARTWRALGLAMLASVFTFFLARLPERLPSVQQIPSWPAVATWDLAAVSVREQRVLLPREVLFLPDDPLPLLAEHYSPASNVPTLVSGGVRSNFLFPYSASVSRDLRARWLALPFMHPHAYFTHRLAVSALLFGWARDPIADRQVLMPGIVPYQDNPALSARSDALNLRVQSALQAMVPTPLFQGWAYLLLGTVLCTFGWRRGCARGRLAAAVAASGLCYALPLALVTGSAEFRYLSWLIAACVLAALLLLPARVTAQDATLLPDPTPGSRP